MLDERRSGLLLHPTSLEGGHGVGDLGPAAYEFLDFLAAAGQTLWQVLPLGPTGFADSPYQTFSVFAGNPLLISLDKLAEEGMIGRAVMRGVRFAEGRASYEAAQAFKLPLVERIAEEYAGSREFDEFRQREAWWLDDFAEFMVLKRLYGMRAWWEWDARHRDRRPDAMAKLRQEKAAEIRAVVFEQWLFFRQWHELREACHERGVRLVGDIPIYAAGDSADVWRARHLWEIREDGRPVLVAGVPPDYFSATGQLWGNPIYRWEEMKRDGYRWWVDRFRATLEMVDVVRVDHFRGFQAYWRVPGGETTAIHGEWKPGPGAELFHTLEAALGELPVIAENLGVITPEVEAIRSEFGFPGMAILQFAFGNDPQAPTFRPHNYPREVVAYSGTHDNDTVMGWWTSTGEGDSTRTAGEIQKERRHTLAYLGIEDARELNWKFIRALMASAANTVVFPVQDVLGLGSEARMNMPSTVGKNWLWRLKRGELEEYHARRLKELADLYDRGAK